MNLKKILITLGVVVFVAPNAFAEDVIVHAYTQAPGVPGGWGLMPSVVQLQSVSPAALFDTLRRKKLPTYGDTSFDAKTGIVTIDASKCAYSAIISTELQKTFEQNGFSIKSVVCAKNATVPDGTALARNVTVVPIWLALNEGTQKKVAPDTWVDLGGELVSYTAFAQKVKANDKAIMKAIETAFDSKNDFVQRQTMSAAMGAKLASAEALIAKRLDSKDLSVRANAVRALRSTTNAKLAQQMRDMLAKCSPDACLLLADSAQGAADASLAREAAIALLASAADEPFDRALASLAPKDLAPRLASVLATVANPAHASAIAKKLVGNEEAALGEWMNSQVPTATSVAVANAVLQSNGAADTQVAAHGIIMLDHGFDAAERSFLAVAGRSVFDLDAKTSLNEAQTKALKRAMEAPDPLIAWAAFDALAGVQSVDPEFDVAKAQKDAFATDWTTRKSVALNLANANESADSVRTALVKDSEPRVVHAMLDALSRGRLARFAREIMNVAKTQDETTRRAVLRSLPYLMDNDNANAVSAFVSNELFDASAEIRIAALHALGQIARITADPVVADNALTSMSMTLQDKDPRIQQHTVLALLETGSDAAKALVENSANLRK